MGKIVAIGGGNIGRPGILVETLEIDLEIIRLSGKKHPKLLFVPTATSDAESYCEAVQQHFGGRLNCLVDILYLIKNPQATKEIEEKVLASDIVYVGGGNTLKMLNFINALCCPHYDTEADRKEHAKTLMSKTPGMGIALDNCAALESANDQYRIITSKSEANAYRVYWLKGTYHEEIIQKTTVFLPLVNLLKK